MDLFFDFIINFFGELIGVLENYAAFNIWGYYVSLLDIMLGALILSFAVSFLWRGARG